MRFIPRIFIVAMAAIAALSATPSEAQRRHQGGRSSHGYDRHHGHGGGFSLNLNLFGRARYYPRYRPYYYGPYPYVSYQPSYYVPAVYGEIDTDVKPTDCTVYLDGVAVGRARDLDGWPTKLEASPGRHELTFREPGYQPLTVVVEVRPYHTIQIREHLVPGADDRAEYYREPPRQSGYSSESSLSPPVMRSASAAIVLSIEPPDASVYLDGVVARDGGGAVGRLVLPVSPGEHRIEVVKPGYRPFAASLTVGDRQRQELAVVLEP